MSHDRLLRTLVDRALAPPTPQPQPAATTQRPAQNVRKGRAAAAAQHAEQAAAPKQAAVSQAASEALLDLAEEPSYGRAVLKLVLERAATPGREVKLCLSQYLVEVITASWPLINCGEVPGVLVFI